MKNLILLTLILFTHTAVIFGQDCKKLEDGAYLFKYKDYKKSNFLLTINGDSSFITKDDKVYPKGKIEWWPGNCMFKLVPLEQKVKEEPVLLAMPQKRDSINVIQKEDVSEVLRRTFESRGGYCFELNGKRKFRLTYCGNLHITVFPGEGRIIKK